MYPSSGVARPPRRATAVLLAQKGAILLGFGVVSAGCCDGSVVAVFRPDDDLEITILRGYDAADYSLFYRTESGGSVAEGEFGSISEEPFFLSLVQSEDGETVAIVESKHPNVALLLYDRKLRWPWPSYHRHRDDYSLFPGRTLAARMKTAYPEMIAADEFPRERWNELRIWGNW